MDIEKHFSQNKSMLQSFKEQTYGEKSCSDIDREADDREVAGKELSNKNLSKALTQLSSSSDIKSITSIPSKINSESLNSKTKPHDHFKNYDHSCEKVRHSFKNPNRLNVGDVGDVMGGDMFDGSNDID